MRGGRGSRAVLIYTAVAGAVALLAASVVHPKVWPPDNRPGGTGPAHLRSMLMATNAQWTDTLRIHEVSARQLIG